MSLPVHKCSGAEVVGVVGGAEVVGVGVEGVALEDVTILGRGVPGDVSLGEEATKEKNAHILKLHTARSIQVATKGPGKFL